VTGWSQSTGLATTGAYQTTLSGSQDAIVAQVSADGSSLGWLSYLGGGNSEEGDGVAVDASQNVYVAGLTKSTTPTAFPTSNAIQSSFGGGIQDAFISAFNAGGGSLAWSTYYGGSGDDNAAGLALDLDNNVYVIGSTTSTNLSTVSAFQGSYGGSTDAFLAKIAQPPPVPVISSISTDSGASSTDQVTTDQTLSLSGTSVASATITLYRASVGQIGTTTADGSGNWTFDYTGTTLSEGVYAFTASATANGKTSAETIPFLVNVDRTAPSVTVNADASTYTKAPLVRVTATDLDLAVTTTVTLDVDNNNNGNFTDAGESGYMTGTLTNGVALLTLSPALTSTGTVGIRARVSDLAGNEGTSITASVQVVSSGSGYTATDLTQQVDPFTGDPLLQRGNVTLSQPLDLDQSPGTADGGSPALVYNSERVGVKPIIQASVQLDNSISSYGTLTATLTWNGGTPQTGQGFATSGLASGDLALVGQQVSTAVSTTGRYVYSLQMNLATPAVSRTVTGVAYVVAEDNSPFGAGWTLAGVDKLVSVTATLTYAAGMLREYGSGGYGFYADNGAGGYTSPAGDNGTLSKATAGGVTTYTYSRPDGSTQTFDSNGYEVKATSADGFAAITYTYTSGNLTGIATPDGALTTLTLASGKVTTIATGSRSVLLTQTGSDLTTIQNADGALQTLAYDGNHHLTDDRLSVLRGTYAYSSGVETGFTTGDSSSDSSAGSSTVSPAILSGLSSLAAGPVFASVTDPLGRVAREQMDTSGRPTLVLAPNGAATQLSRDANGRVTKITDPLNRVTTLVLDSAGYPTQVTTPDGSTVTNVYQASFHALTSTTDPLNHTTTLAYDATTGHLLTVKNALNQVTTFTYNATSGLPETVTDALGRVTTALYDASRRVQTTINALGDRATLTYDSNGNVATQVDQLGRTTTFVNDALGRVTQKTDAAGGIWTTTYNGAGEVTSQTDALGHTKNFTYNSRGETSKEVDAAGSSVETSKLSSFDTAGQQTSGRDANGNTSYQSFNAFGALSTATDALGGKQQGFYDLAGEQTLSLDALGRPTTRTFDSMGRVKTVTDALSNVTTTIYDAAGNITELDNARGYKTTDAYDALNRQTAMTQAAGTSDAATTTTVYDAVGNVYQTLDPLGHTSQNDYDALNRVTTLTQALGTGDQRVMTYAYDKVGNQTSLTDWRGYHTNTTFDKLNRATVVTEAVGTSIQRVTTTVYDAVGNVTSRVDGLGHTLSIVYDALNREVSRTEAVGTSVARTTTTLYDAAGDQTGAVDPMGAGNQSAVDALGRKTVDIDALGNVARTYYDGAGAVRATVDANGNRTDYFTDGLGRTQRIVDALGGTTTLLYDAVGNQTGTIDPRGNRSTVTYDGLNRVIAQTDALNHTVTTVFDKASNVVQQVDAQGKTLTYTYDNLNRQITMQDPGTGVTTTVYDAAGNAVNTIDPLGHKGTMVYDELGRKTKEIDALGGTTTYLYDLLNNQTGVIDPDGNRTTFTLDALNRLTQETDPLNHSMTMAYDSADRLTSRTDRLGQRMDNSYDLDGRLVTQTWHNASGTVVNTLTFAYDGVGNQTVAQDSHGAYTMTFDALNRANVIKGLYGVTLTYTFDAVGNRTKTQDSFGGVLTSVYDNANRLTTQQFGGSGQTPLRFDLGYTARNQVATLTRYSDLAGTTKVGESDYTYDAAGRLQNLQHKNGSGTLLANYTYTYDLASRVTSETFNGAAPTTYVYDNTNQLTNDGTKAYSYDANGNRTMAGYTTGADNQLTNDGVYTYTYDAEGNLTKKSKGASAETWTFSYDNRNQMTGVTERSTDGGGTLLLQATYTYNVFNRRIQEDKWVSGTGSTTVRLAYFSDGTVWADLDGSNNLVTRYLHRDGAVQPVARVASGAATWLLEDHLGTVRNTTNGSGVVNGTVVYDGYGNITSETSPTATGRYAYTGLVFDRELGLLFAAKRVDNPATGEWLQQDPIRFSAGDTKLDRYVSNNPTNATDPSGLRVWFPDDLINPKKRPTGCAVYDINIPPQDIGCSVTVNGPGCSNFLGGRNKPRLGVEQWQMWAGAARLRMADADPGRYLVQIAISIEAYTAWTSDVVEAYIWDSSGVTKTYVAIPLRSGTVRTTVRTLINVTVEVKNRGDRPILFYFVPRVETTGAADDSRATVKANWIVRKYIKMEPNALAVGMLGGGVPIPAVGQIGFHRPLPQGWVEGTVHGGNDAGVWP
jgi:RHS repeat-associated protein